jgi:hypothetical protein
MCGERRWALGVGYVKSTGVKKPPRWAVVVVQRSFKLLFVEQHYSPLLLLSCHPLAWLHIHA